MQYAKAIILAIVILSFVGSAQNGREEDLEYITFRDPSVGRILPPPFRNTVREEEDLE